MAAAPVPNDFAACLARFDMNPATIEYLRTEGVGDAEQLENFPLATLDEFYKNINKPDNFPIVAVRNGGPVKLIFPHLLALKGLRAWIDYRRARGQNLDVNLFIGDEMVREWQKRAAEMIAINSATASRTEGTLPPVLRTDWRSFEELFRTYLLHRRSTFCGTPLAYVIRETAVPTADMLGPHDYGTIDDCLVATHSHAHSAYRVDNNEVFDLFKRLIYTSNFWQFAMAFDVARDGRGAFFAVKAQAEGQSAVITQRAAAYKMIKDAKYMSATSRYTFDHYISDHQKGHNELQRLAEPVPETKKVNEFLDGIKEPGLQTAIQIVQSNPDFLNNFERCQHFLKTMSLTLKNSSSNRSPNVSSVGTTARAGRGQSANKRGRGTRDNNNNNKRNKTTAGRRDQNPKRNLPRIRTGHYSEEEWKALSDHDRGLVLDLRSKQKQANATAAAVSTSPAADAAPANATASISSITVSVQPTTESELRDALARTNISPPASAAASVSGTVTLGQPRKAERPHWFDSPPAIAVADTTTAPTDAVIASVTTEATGTAAAAPTVAAAAAPIIPPAAAVKSPPAAAAAKTPNIGQPWYNKLDNPRTLTKNQKSKRAKHIKKMSAQPVRITHGALSDDSESYDNGCYHESGDSDYEDSWVDPVEAYAAYVKGCKKDPVKALARYRKDMDDSTIVDQPPAGPKTDD
jgi:hypothetical protein